MRNAFAQAVHECGSVDPRIFVVVADISPAGSIARFREENPSRFINVGVAEQAMIGICAGLALKGMRPFAYTIATFSLYRPFEMVRDDLCYQNLPVTVVGVGGGVVYSTLGSTHHAQEDVAIASALPGMTVLAPCDPIEARMATEWCAREEHGPVYLRLGKAGEPELTRNAVDPWTFGKLRRIEQGSDVCILSYGVVTHKALEAARRIRAGGLSTTVCSVHTLKPLDVAGITEMLHSHRRVIVLEEHAPRGGLTAEVKQIAWDTRAPCSIASFTLQDAFVHTYGSHDELLRAHGIDLERIVAAAG